MFFEPQTRLPERLAAMVPVPTQKELAAWQAYAATTDVPVNCERCEVFFVARLRSERQKIRLLKVSDGSATERRVAMANVVGPDPLPAGDLAYDRTGSDRVRELCFSNDLGPAKRPKRRRRESEE